ncbi:hypothetical protein D3C72_2553220 [compost metagenome]
MVDRHAHVFRIGYVGLQYQALAARRPDVVKGFDQLFFGAAEQADKGALCRKMQGGGPADA